MVKVYNEIDENETDFASKDLEIQCMMNVSYHCSYSPLFCF